MIVGQKRKTVIGAGAICAALVAGTMPHGVAAKDITIAVAIAVTISAASVPIMSRIAMRRSIASAGRAGSAAATSAGVR